LGASRTNWLVLLLQFYANSILSEKELLLFQVDGLVLVAVDGVANLGRGLAQPGLPVGEERLFGALGALGACAFS
jgi:hypothetical protein